MRIFHNGTRDAHAVKRGSTSAYLIVNNQALLRRVLQNVRHLGHLQHKGGLPRSKVVRRAHAGENLIHDTDARLVSGHKAADLRHERDQRNLAHVGGFTCHIGTRDQHQSVRARIKIGIVGHEIRILNELLDYGVSAVLDVDRVARIHLGTHVLIACGNRGKRKIRVYLGKQRCCALHARAVLCHVRTDLLEQLVFQSAHAITRAQNFGFHCFELLGNITLTVYQGLLTDKVIGHLIGKGTADLNIVAEHLVVSHFQRLDACTLTLGSHHLLHPGFTVVHDGAQLVHLLGIAGGNHTAVTHREGRLLANARVDLT